jgi:hypothetical protein
VAADQTHRDHAAVEQVFADPIDGPLGHLPSGRFGANAAWLTLAGNEPTTCCARGFQPATTEDDRHSGPARSCWPASCRSRVLLQGRRRASPTVSPEDASGAVQ